MMEQWDKQEELQDIPDEYLCPITCEIMEDPVITSDGHTYERKAIKKWLEAHRSSPLTGEPLAHRTLESNYALRNAIERFKKNLPAIQIRKLTEKDLDYAIQIREEEIANFTTLKQKELGTSKIIHEEQHKKIQELTQRVSSLESNFTQEKKKNVKLESSVENLLEKLNSKQSEVNQLKNNYDKIQRELDIANKKEFSKSPKGSFYESQGGNKKSKNPKFFQETPNYEELVKRDLTRFPKLDGRSYQQYYKEHAWLIQLAKDKNATITINTDYDSEDEYGEYDWKKSILTEVAERGLEKLLEKIIKKGANVNKPDVWIENICEIADVFDGGGPAYFNDEIKHIDYPLHRAIENGNKECVKILLKYGADTNLCNEHGQTALELAKSKGMDNLFNSATSKFSYYR